MFAAAAAHTATYPPRAHKSTLPSHNRNHDRNPIMYCCTRATSHARRAPDTNYEHRATLHARPRPFPHALRRILHARRPLPARTKHTRCMPAAPFSPSCAANCMPAAPAGACLRRNAARSPPQFAHTAPAFPTPAAPFPRAHSHFPCPPCPSFTRVRHISTLAPSRRPACCAAAAPHFPRPPPLFAAPTAQLSTSCLCRAHFHLSASTVVITTPPSPPHFSPFHSTLYTRLPPSPRHFSSLHNPHYHCYLCSTHLFFIFLSRTLKVLKRGAGRCRGVRGGLAQAHFDPPAKVKLFLNS